ncbi:MAG: hypothetical protein OXU23_11045 [Candidatus Poribacteria bacterium]|nr:hypothetical protein [Candidatus Poribacteria bacterium]
MLSTALGIMRDGKIEILEHIALPEGQRVLVTMLPNDDIFWREASRVLVTMLPNDDIFWREASQETLKQIWDNTEDDVYARLLDK